MRISKILLKIKIATSNSYFTKIQWMEYLFRSCVEPRFNFAVVQLDPLDVSLNPFNGLFAGCCSSSCLRVLGEESLDLN